MAARPLPKTDTPPVITINSDGTWSGAVTISPGDTVQFNLPTYKSGYNQCKIYFAVRWENRPAADPPGTIIIGS